MNRAIRCLAVALISAVPLSAADVVINEIHFQPPDKTVPDEFIELYNAGDEEVDLSFWFFSDGVTFTFPEGTTLAPGGYLVIAEDPAVLEESFGVTDALGPYEGRLANEGELVMLRNPSGGREDRVGYEVGFPWPIAPAGGGSSMELINPHLDNNLGGSWRPSGFPEGPPTERLYLIVAEDDQWRYRKGTSEASDPVSAWRQIDFEEDDTWLVGRTSIGHGDDDDNTVLDDMRGNYTSVFLRHTFFVDGSEDLPRMLKLRIYVDDGAIYWINGIEVARYFMRDGDYPFDGTAGRSGEARWQEVFLPNPARYLRGGENVLAIHAFNLSLNSADFSIDAELFVPGSDDLSPEDLLAEPTPGLRNAAFAANASPQIRQVAHSPQQPASGEPIAVTAKITDPDGVSAVLLEYQIVAPGDYIPAFLPLPHNQLIANARQPLPPNAAFEDPANWTTLELRDEGYGGDATPADDVYTAVIPGQPNRTLVRYRISAEDSHALSVRVPYRDDKSLNFACFVYDGVPPYTASLRSVHPEGPGHVYSAELMNSLPVYHLITRAEDLSQCIAYNTAFQIPKSNEPARDKFNWEGALVYDGLVYDHMKYRLRQANDRYGGRGKRSMRFRFNRGNYFRIRDNYGTSYPTRWRTINTGKMFDNKDVGNFGLTETLNHNLWNLVGVPSPWIHTFHLRVIDAVEEVPADPSTGQYFGDFWGMFIAMEDYDARFMDTHRLEDGNLYKLKDGIFSGHMLRRNQGRYAVTTDADFQNIRANLRPERTDEWLQAHVNYERWYPYHAVVEGIRHYDFRPSDTHSKNRAWYFEPSYEGSEFGRLWTLPWDSDASWGPNWNSGVDYSKNAIFAGGGKPAFKQKYRNFIREFRDLIWTEEVIFRMIDDLAAIVGEFAKADRDRWRAAPPQAGTQDFGTMEAKVVDMKRFAFTGWSGSTGPTVPAGGRARHLENLANAEGDAAGIPETPTVTTTAPSGFPIDSLTFVSSPFADPQGEAFASMKWRVGEISDPDAPFDPGNPRIYEWPAVWELELDTFVDEITVPTTAVKMGHTYRVRVKMQDVTGRWSHWSEPAEFTAGEPAGALPQLEYLRVTEIMYHPMRGSGYEFIELRNIGTEPVDLRGVQIREAVDFSFADGDVVRLEPGEYVVVVENLDVFATLYEARDIRIAGQYSGRLSNAGERIELIYGVGLPILDFEYDDGWYTATDGLGHSLVIRDAGAIPEIWGFDAAWRPSSRVHGSPGGDDVDHPAGLQLPGNVNQDGGVNVSDAVVIFRQLFSTYSAALPCGNGTLEEESNRTLLDLNGDRRVNLSDGVHLLTYLFMRGSPPALGTECAPIADCPEACPP